MKPITIGLAGPDWRAAKQADYYAERGHGDDYAFGVTPTEALLDCTAISAAKLLEALIAEVLTPRG